MKNKIKKISANVDVALYEKVVAEASKEGRTISNWLAKVVEDYLVNKEAPR